LSQLAAASPDLTVRNFPNAGWTDHTLRWDSRAPQNHECERHSQFHRLDFAAARRQNRGMADEHSRRTEKLESHMAHLEHQVEQLNAVVIEQGRLLERLKKETQRQSRAMEALELERIKSNNPKPPHYQ
jgi:SlyX protein